MRFPLLAGAAFAALMGLALPAAATSLPSPVPAQASGSSTDRAVTTFYEHRNGKPLWLAKGDSSGARELIATLRRASLDGMPSGPALASEAERLIVRANAGDTAALGAADRLLSTAWVLYVQNLQRTPTGMTIADGWAAPRAQPALEILQRAALARSLSSHVRSVSTVNPIYAQLREAAWQELPLGGTPDPRVLANLARARAMPFQDRYIMVDAGSARLWMVENDRIVDSMKVIVGKPSTQTPMLASTIYRATLNPYWNVPQDLVQRLIAPRVVEQGLGYLKSHGYQVLSGYGDDAEMVDASKVDWRAVAAGREVVKVRQLPGPGNSMGQVKFSFPNSDDIFLHDTPKKELFASADRDVSNGCIRLEDAQRLGRWLLGREPVAYSSSPEQHVLLPKPVPVYVTYLTADANGGRLSVLEDAYGRDIAFAR